jgi:hypothetical protein
LLALLCCAWPLSVATAAEPFREFLDGLRARDLHDVALLYIEQCRTSPLIDDETRSTLDFEEARLLVEGAHSIRDVNRRTEQLESARAKFQAFIDAHPDHALAPSASTQLGTILLERGRTKLERASRPTNADQREPLTAEARQLFEQAAAVFAAAETKFKTLLESFPRFIDSKDRARVQAREQARLDLIQAELSTAQVLFERAKSYPADSTDFKKLMQEAGDKYAAIYDTNRRLMAGLYARMWQGRCQQELGNTKQALTYYGDLLVQPDEPEAFRLLKAQTLRLAMQCWTSDDQRKFDEAIRQGTDWLERSRDQSQSAEGLAIRWLLSQAHHQRAQDANLDPDLRKQDETAAQKHATLVSQISGDFQRTAQEFISRRSKSKDKPSAPQNFADARDAGKTALDEMELALRRFQDIQATGNAEAIAEIQAQVSQQRSLALEMFRLALTLDDAEVTSDDVNQVRYFLCYLYYQSASPLEAAVMGEFLARRYPDCAGARPAARIALAAYLQSYNAAPPHQRSAEIARMNSIAEYIVTRFSGQPDADEAAMVLADVALREKQFALAAQHLARIPDGSPKRVEADLKAGQALWAAYLAQPTDDPAAQANREKLLAEARTLLDRGRTAALKQSGDLGALLANLVGAELSLAQLHLLEAAPEKAVEILERPQSGPLALAESKHAVAARGNFALEAYKAALQAYVGTQALDRAQRMMTLLEQQAQATPESGAALTRIYLALGYELQRQVTRLRTENKQAELQRTLESFDQFLKQISESPAGSSYNSLTWIAQTYLALGSGLATADKPGGSAKSDEQARNYYDKAARAYDRLLQAAAQDPSFAPQPEALVVAKIQLARCDRLMGNYQESLDLLVELLKQRPSMLDAQIEAAETYQAWGAADPNQYNFAVHGGRKAKKPDGSIVNIVWGWRKIATTVQQNPKFQAQYYEAVYHLAQCAADHAAARTGAEREKSLQSARSLIEQLARTRPDLGGEEWFTKFDTLYRRVEGDLGQPVGGLKKLQDTFATQAATS